MKAVAKNILVSVCAILICSCSNSELRVVGNYSTTVDFSSYRTFAWAGSDPMYRGPDDIRPAVKQHIEQLIVEGFSRKGIAQIPYASTADILVAYTVSAEGKIQEKSIPGFDGAYVFTGDLSDQPGFFNQGQLSIVAVDPRIEGPAWLVSSIKPISTDEQSDPRPLITDAITRMFATFPNR